MTGALAYVGVCVEAPSVVLVEEATCISYVKEKLFKWKVARFLLRKQRANHPFLIHRSKRG